MAATSPLVLHPHGKPHRHLAQQPAEPRGLPPPGSARSRSPGFHAVFSTPFIHTYNGTARASKDGVTLTLTSTSTSLSDIRAWFRDIFIIGITYSIPSQGTCLANSSEAFLSSLAPYEPTVCMHGTAPLTMSLSCPPLVSLLLAAMQPRPQHFPL